MWSVSLRLVCIWILFYLTILIQYILYTVPLYVDSISQCVSRQNLKINSLCRESSCLLFRVYSVYWTPMWSVRLYVFIVYYMYFFPLLSIWYHHYHQNWKVNTLWHEVNSLRPSDALWRHRYGSTLAATMACCLTTPSHRVTEPTLSCYTLWLQYFSVCFPPKFKS